MNNENIIPLFPIPNTIIVADISDAQCQYLKYYNSLGKAGIDCPRGWVIHNYTTQKVVPGGAGNKIIDFVNIANYVDLSFDNYSLADLYELDGSIFNTFAYESQGILDDIYEIINPIEGIVYTVYIQVTGVGNPFVVRVRGYTTKWEEGTPPVVSAVGSGEIDIFTFQIIGTHCLGTFKKGFA